MILCVYLFVYFSVQDIVPLKGPHKLNPCEPINCYCDFPLNFLQFNLCKGNLQKTNKQKSILQSKNVEDCKHVVNCWTVAQDDHHHQHQQTQSSF